MSKRATSALRRLPTRSRPGFSSARLRMGVGHRPSLEQGDRMLRPVHRSHVLGVVVVIAALGRTERVAEPELVTPVMTPEQFAPVDDTDVIRGALFAEATVQLPESGGPFRRNDALDAWTDRHDDHPGDHCRHRSGQTGVRANRPRTYRTHHRTDRCRCVCTLQGPVRPYGSNRWTAP